MITLLSYVPGMSGDFLSYLIHKNPDYVDIELTPTLTNRYLFPCFTENINGREIKVTREKLDNQTIKILNEKYYNKKLVLPTHQFKKIYNNNLNYVRLFSSNEYTTKLSYAMWMIKSHSDVDEPWPQRYEEIKKIQDHSIRNEIIQHFHKWKYLAYKNNLLVDGKFDLYYYIKNYYVEYKNMTQRIQAGYQYIDIHDTIYESNTDILNNIFNINIDCASIYNYANQNIDILTKNNINPAEDLFFQQLYNMLFTKLNETINLYELFE